MLFLSFTPKMLQEMRNIHIMHKENQIALKAQGVGSMQPLVWMMETDGNAFYPTDNTRKDIVLGEYIYKNDGSFKYPLNRDGHPVYETDDTTNDEVYFIKNDGSINWGVDRKGNQRYAKNENGDEYYPPNGEFSCDHSGSPQNALTSDGEVIFSSDAHKNESYIKNDAIGGSHVIYMGDVLLDRYAKTSNGEGIYPIQITNQTHREVILNEKYAKMDLLEAKYPLDEYGNEYTLEIPIQIAGKEKDYFPQGYPIKNDNLVTVPEVNGKKFISDQLLPKVQANNIINKLHREFKNYPDYVTNIKSTRQSRAARQGYLTMALKNVEVNANNPPQNNPLNLPQIPKNKQLPKISHQINWSLIRIVFFLFCCWEWDISCTNSSLKQQSEMHKKNFFF
ncbi:uncharacterized protein TNIN_424521 [Trichonephila inaurata madagascariensis]|uniref:Uncharacterized protein n=1 Tax=Trichonephila inaurata madagascariensis TaxID=2747483 RepID=A0A8X7C878_9ARAC|nr:uncharacterized protein TNIN_424521 [Trichonephila inaurata madagascariensis]